MRPLLEITTVKPQYEYNVSHAKLQISQEQPRVNRTTQRASLNMRQQAGRFEMNSVRRRSDMGFKGVVDQARYQGDLGRKAASEATGNYADIGNQLAQIHYDTNIPDTLYGKSMIHNQGNLVLVPVSPVDIHYIPASLAADFQPGSMQSDWNIGKARLDFVPPEFGLNFTQYASIEFSYTGGPIYVPPSSDPNFEADA